MIGILAERKLKLRPEATPHDADILPELAAGLEPKTN